MNIIISIGFITFGLMFLAPLAIAYDTINSKNETEAAFYVKGICAIYLLIPLLNLFAYGIVKAAVLLFPFVLTMKEPF